MTPAEVFLTIAKDEMQTLVDYQRMVDESELDDSQLASIQEIMGDEFNHALIAMYHAKEILGIKIATDDIKPDPNDVEVDKGGE